MRLGTPLPGLGLGLAMGIVLCACTEDVPLATGAGEFFPDADAVVIGGEHFFSNAQGILASQLRFDTLYSWNDSIQSQLRGVVLITFNADGSERARVTALRGTIDSRYESFTALGNVILDVPGEGMHMETEELRYDSQADQIASDTCFVLTRAGGAPLRGSIFRSDLGFQNVQAQDLGGCAR
ncbi:MAG: hypothetical protein EXR92_07280 [Gemmatimonadetes bacterium]|nr:hypothetical protein [Gemmatimonadota bacterium]